MLKKFNEINWIHKNIPLPLDGRIIYISTYPAGFGRACYNLGNWCWVSPDGKIGGYVKHTIHQWAYDE